MSSFYPGQRLSTKGNRCTVRYVGEVQGKRSEWLGVEWDDPTRGKHSGTHENFQYFKCRSSHPTAASFIRPSAPWDKPRTFVQALKSKYASTRGDSDIPYDPEIEIVRISGKTAEEVGFDKIARQQAQLENLRIVILDDMLVKHEEDAENSLSQTCPSITSLDLGRNLFETLSEIASICSQLDKLQSLKLDGNRFRNLDNQDSKLPKLKGLDRLTTLEIDSLLPEIMELDTLLVHFPNLKHLSASHNLLGSLDRCRLPRWLNSITLEDNDFTTLEDVSWLNMWCGQLRTLNLKNNHIKSTFRKGSKNYFGLPQSINELDLSYNEISSWDIINNLPQMCSGLKHLRVSQNPLFDTLRAADGKLLTSADGYMLTIARLPKLETLNYSTITDKERLNAETYYLSQIAMEISRASVEQEADIIAQHPRYRDLCEEYGEPRIERKEDNKIDPNSLAARLIKCSFYCRDISSAESLATRDNPSVVELPNTLNIYALMGTVGKRFGLLPMRLKLTWETGEKERVKPPANTWAGVQEWDSSDDDADDFGDEWKEREVELVAGTRPLGTVVESVEAVIRVELMANPRDLHT